MPIEFNAQGIRAVRDATGHGVQAVRNAFELARTDERFGKDPLLALAFLDRMGRAVMIHGDREAWALRGAGELAERLRKQVEDMEEQDPGSPAP